MSHSARLRDIAPAYATSVSVTPMYATSHAVIRTATGELIASEKVRRVSSAQMIQRADAGADGQQMSRSEGTPSTKRRSPPKPPSKRASPYVSPTRTQVPGRHDDAWRDEGTSSSGQDAVVEGSDASVGKAEQDVQRFLEESSSSVSEEEEYATTQSLLAPEFDAPGAPPVALIQPMDDPFESSSSEEEYIKSFVGGSTIEVELGLCPDEPVYQFGGANDSHKLEDMLLLDGEEEEAELPPLPDFPPPKTEKEAYKEYMILRYEYQRRGLLKKVTTRLTLPNSPRKEIEKIEIPISGPRDKIAREILTTEQTYVHHLGVLCRVYLKPLLAWSEEKKQHNINLVFSEVTRCAAVLYPVHRELLDAIEVRMRSWGPEQTIGEVFGLLAAHLKNIAAYVRAYEEIVVSLDDCEKNSSFMAAVTGFKQDPACKSLDLRSHLILPVQRVPRYELLLRDFMKHTDKSHPDFPRLKIALAQVESVALGVNEAVRAAVNARKVAEINAMFVTDPGLNDDVPRALLKEGELFRKGRRPGPRKMFLFSDLLVYARYVTQTKYLLSQKIELSHLRVEDMPDDPYTDPPLINALLFKSSTKTFLACSNTVGQKQEWLEALEGAMKAVTKRRNSSFIAPIWQPNNASPACPICSAKFSIIRPRHHCRSCGSLACDSCSSHRLTIESLAAAPIRVCKKCFIQKQSELLLEEPDLPNVNM